MGKITTSQEPWDQIQLKKEKKMVEINSENYPEYIIEGDKEIKNMRGYQIQGIN